MIFVDTSAWLALADTNDGDHAAALDLQHRLGHGEFGKQVTTNCVMTETVTLIRRRLGLGSAIAFSNNLRSSKAVGLFWVEPVHHYEAIDLMSSHEDKHWSVTDCTSFVIMRSLGIRDAFAFDDDFVQAGFKAYP